MSRSIFFSGMLVLTALLGCQHSSENPGSRSKSESSAAVSAANPIEVATVKGKTMLLEDDTTLRYSVYLPTGYDAQKPMPLVFALHYGGSVTPFYGGGMIEILTAPGLEELNAIIVAPDSLDGGWGSEKNRGAVGQLLERIRVDYKIDENKTLLTGFSMGGHGTWVIAAAFPDRFKAAIPIAGRGLQDSAAAAMKELMPFYVIHSLVDEVVPIDPTREWVEKVKAAGGDVTFVEVEGLSHFKTYTFAKPLADAVPWVKSIWNVEE